MQAPLDAEAALVGFESEAADAGGSAAAPRRGLALRARPLLGLAALFATAFGLGWVSHAALPMPPAQQGQIAAVPRAVPEQAIDMFSVSAHMRNLTSWLNNRAEDVDSLIAQAQDAMSDVNESLHDTHAGASDRAADRLASAQDSLSDLHEDARFAVNSHLQSAENALSNAHQALNNPELHDQVNGYLDQAQTALGGVHDDARSAMDCAQTCDTSNYGDDSDCEGGFWTCSGQCGWLVVLSCNRDCVMQKVNCFSTAANNYRACMAQCTSGGPASPAPA